MANKMLVGSMVAFAGVDALICGMMAAVGVAPSRALPMSTLGLAGTIGGFIFGTQVISWHAAQFSTRNARDTPSLGIYMVLSVIGTAGSTIVAACGGVWLAKAWLKR